MSKNFIHIAVSPLGKPLAQGLYIDEMQRLGYAIYYLDLSQALGMGSNKHVDEYKKIIHEFTTIADMEIFLSKFDRTTTIVNTQLFRYPKITPLFEKIEQLDFIKTYFDFDNFPEPFWKIILRHVKYFFQPYPLQPDYLFKVGKISLVQFNKIKKVFPLNHPTYDFAKNYLSSHQARTDKTVIFVDQSLPSHPDWSVVGSGKNDIEFDPYYKNITDYLKHVAKVTDLKPIIAAHPKNEQLSDSVFGVEVRKGETDSLIRNCNLVLMHSSVAMSTAILFRKPIQFIICDVVLQSIQGNYVLFQTKRLADYFSQKVVRIDRESFSTKALVVNEKKYPKYEYDFLTSPQSADFRSNDLLKNYLTELFAIAEKHC